jgi:hypothetical protein
MKPFKLADLNPHFCEYLLRSDHSAPYYTLANATPLVPPEPSPVPT